MKNYSVAIIGLGYWGPNILRNVIEIEKFKDIYCFDLDRQKLEKNRQRFPIVKIADSYEEILDNKDIEDIFICTPPGTHYCLAAKAMEKGKNVMIEKPLTRSAEEAKDLIKKAEDKSLVLMVGHTFEFSPAVEKVKQIIDEDILGEIYFVTMTRINLGIHRKDVSVIWDLATHDFSILFKLIEGYPRKISAIANSFVTAGLKDVAFINIKYDNGIIVNMNVSWLSPKKVREIIIVGSKKMLIYDDTQGDEKIKIYDRGVDLLRDPEGFGEYQLTYRTGDIISPVIEATEPLKIEIRHFLDCVDNELKPLTDGYSGLKVVKAVTAAEMSAENDGQVIMIDEL